MADALCPRCNSPLATNEDDDGILRCIGCAGSYVPRSQLDAGSGSPGDVDAATHASADDASTATPTNCPVCRVAMLGDRIAEATLFRCRTCGGIWADGIEPSTDDSVEGLVTSAQKHLIYGLTLPERVLRSTVGVTAGAAKGAATFLIPSAFQSSKTYEVVVRNSLRFLAEDVGGVAKQDDAEDLGKDFAARKAVGNFVDLAGWASLAFSPVWMMAVVSDVAYGSKSYVRELADELKKDGLIDENSTINNIDDVLEAVQDASGKAASLVDTPPLSVDQLKDSLSETREAVASADVRRMLPEAELKAYWQEMRAISSQENVSLIGVSGALTMHTLGKVGTVSRGTFTGIKVAGGMFNRVVLGHYVDSLKTMKENGFYKTLSESSGPYIEAVWNNFGSERKTWTEEIVTGRAIGGMFRAVRSFFTRSKPDTEATERVKE